MIDGVCPDALGVRVDTHATCVPTSARKIESHRSLQPGLPEPRRRSPLTPAPSKQVNPTMTEHESETIDELRERVEALEKELGIEPEPESEPEYADWYKITERGRTVYVPLNASEIYGDGDHGSVCVFCEYHFAHSWWNTHDEMSDLDYGYWFNRDEMEVDIIGVGDVPTGVVERVR